MQANTCEQTALGSGAATRTVRVVVFTGGRGSELLSRELLKDDRIELTLAINGYDDGASTGEVRRFLGDALGPSDYRKNALRLAGVLGTCDPQLIHALDARLPVRISRQMAFDAIRQRTAPFPSIRDLAERFLRDLSQTAAPFAFDDCNIGNLVFAGAFLDNHRRFNDAVDDYCARLGLRRGIIENVTSGENAYLVGFDGKGELLPTEASIAAGGPLSVREIFLLRQPFNENERSALRQLNYEEQLRYVAGRAIRPTLNPRLAKRLADANVIIYAPGTQHSSLYPSYLTTSMADTIAANLAALKLMVTNIQQDAEMAGMSAVDIIQRALYYLTTRGARAIPPPCLITHYMVNEPGHVEPTHPHVPLGLVDAIEDPRLIRIGNFEDGVSGRHDAARLLGPFITSLVQPPRRPRVAVLLEKDGSLNKTTQTLLEMVRGGIGRLPLDVSVLHHGAPLDAAFVRSLPFAITALGPDESQAEALVELAADYVMVFESSGMYRGEDVVALGTHLVSGRFDAIWGSRRLSLHDIDESIRWRYSASPVAAAVSRLGSELLSLTCLVRYGRYISDTLSGVRAVRLDDVLAIRVPLTHPHANQHLLASLLGRGAEVLEVPVQFLPISPERVRRTRILDGIGALGRLLAGGASASQQPQSSSARRALPPWAA